MYKLQLPTLEDPKQTFNDNVLKIQNVSLSTRLDFLKKTINDQKSLITELVEREIRHQKFFNFLEITWRGFLQRSLRIESIIKRKGQLETKYLNAFQYLDEIFNSQYLMCNNLEGQFKSQISHKFEQFLRLIENIYFEISSDYYEFNDNIQKRTQQLIDLENIDYMEYMKKLIQTNKDQIKRNIDIENNFRSILRVRERKINDLDGQIGFQTIFQLQSLLSESKKCNESLVRRIRILHSNYNMQKIEDDETYDCICGGQQVKCTQQHHQLDYLRQTFEPIDDLSQSNHHNEEIKKQQNNLNIQLITQLLIKAVKNKEIKIISSDDEFTINLQLQEIKDLEQILQNYFQSLQQSETYQQQNKKLQQQIIQMQTKIKELEINCEYKEDQFVESETYNLLNTQNFNLIEQNSQLTQQIQVLQQQYCELSVNRQQEILQLTQMYDQEIKKVFTENGQLRLMLNEINQKENKVQHIDLDHIFSNFKARMDSSQKVIDSQMGEIKSQKTINKEIMKQLDDQIRQNQELSIKYQDLEIKNLALMTKGEFNMDELSFRHVKHKEYLQEALSIITRHQPQFKEKFQELIGYVKSRDARIEQCERELSKRDKTISDQKKHQLQMLDETDYNSKVYDEVMQKSKLVETQLSLKENNEAQLILSQTQEKARFDMDRMQFRDREKQLIEQINQLEKQKSNQTQLIQKYSQEKFINNSSHAELNKQTEQYKVDYQKLLNELSVVKIERDCHLSKITKTKLINEESLQEIVLLQSKIVELENLIKQQDELISNPAQLEQVKGYLILKGNEQQEESILIKMKITACCTCCKMQLKDVILSKCMHMLCKECANEAQFKEQCPICKQTINLVDILQTKVQE